MSNMHYIKQTNTKFDYFFYETFSGFVNENWIRFMFAILKPNNQAFNLKVT